MASTLNPNLLGKDTTAIMNDAVAIMDRYRKKNIFPEMALMALIEAKDTAGSKLLQQFAASTGIDLARLARQTRLAVESRRDLPGDLLFVTTANKQVQLSRQMIVAIDEALTIAEKNNEVWVGTDHLLAAMSLQQLGTGGILRQYGITPQSIKTMIGGGDASPASASTSSVARQMGGTAVDYVALAKAGERRPVYFREALLQELINMLSQKINRHVLLLGPDGVGKRTLAYSLALLIAEGKGPVGLNKLVQIDETALLDNPVSAIRAGINKAAGGILFVPQIHRFFDQQTRLRQPKVPADLQKVFLGDNPIIIATTSEAIYNERLESMSGIPEHSQRLRVPEPGEKETIAILQTLKPQLAADYSITVMDDAIKIATTMAQRYMSGTPLPRSAENLLHRAAALVNMNSQQHIAFKTDNGKADSTLDAEDVTLAASQMTGIPVSKLGEDERSRYASMVEHLHERIIGQDEAVLAVSRAVKTARVGLKDKKRPIGGFLFLGPTGVGKTELAKALAEFMFGDEDAMLQLDMSEFQNESTVNRLLGSPSGYVDSEAGGQLTERVRQQPYLIVLFDEIEKAHARVVDILLQVLEEGRLTDGRGNTANFSETVIILTSNLGADYLQTTEITDEIRDGVMEEVESHFRPEFLNRLDEIIIFHPLNEEHLRQILDLLLSKENKLAAGRGLTLEFSSKAKQWMLDQNEHPEWGARPLRRIIRQSLREPLADYLLKENPSPGTVVRINSTRNGLTFKASQPEETT